MDASEPMDFDLAVPLSAADPPRPLTPHAQFDFDPPSHTTSPSSPLANNHSNQGSQPPQLEPEPDISSTLYHPVMNGR